MPTVSVIVPVYNTPKEMIEECLKSVTGQDYKDIELLVIRDEGTGAARARNQGLEKATGEYVCFVDSDDYLSPGAISLMVEAMDGVDMVLGGFRKFGKFEQVVCERTEELIRKEVAMYALLNLKNPRSNQLLSGCWAKLYKTSLVEHFPDLSTAEDMAFNFSYLRRCSKVRFLGSVVYHNRKRSGSLTTTFNEKDRLGLFEVCAALREARGLLKSYASEGELEDAIDNSKVYHAMLYLGRICEYYECSPREAMLKVYPQ
jgi:glycosyltransferase involved in cell wall biosynthesis